MRKLSTTKKAVNERGLRSRVRSERRFNNPLRLFIQHKYRAIYEEYVELYNVMTAKHPRRRDLSTSSTFKEWKAACFAVETATTTTQTSSSAQSTSPDIINRALQEAFTEVAATTDIQIDLNIEHLPSQENLYENTDRLLSPPEQDNNENIDHLPLPPEPNLNNEADDLINELMQDEAIRNLFEQPAEDEGIELNIFDEIEFDIEPFDFDTEVEPFDY